MMLFKGIDWRKALRQLSRSVGLTILLLGLGLSVFFYFFFGKRRHLVFSKLLSLHCRGFLKVLGFYVVRDPYRAGPSSKPTLYLSNHLSYLDVLVMASQWHVGFLAKSEVSAWPFVGFVARCCGTVFVKRNSLLSRAMCIEKICEKLERGQSVVVFPEGTTSVEGPRKNSRPFYRGAISAAKWAEADLKLVCLDYEDAHQIAWLGDDDLLPNLWMILGRPSTRVRIRESDYEICPPRKFGDSKTYSISERQMEMWISESGFNTAS